MFDEASTSARDLALDLLPDRDQVAHGLRRQRVRRRAVEPGDRDVAARLEQHGLALVARVGLRVGEEALARLLAEPALGHQAPQHHGRLERVAPLGVGALELLEHGVEPGLVGAREGPGQDAGAHHHPHLDVLGGGHALLEHEAGLDQGLQTHPLDDAGAPASVAVLIEALSGLLAEVPRLHQLLHLRRHEEALAVRALQVLGHVQDGVEPEQVGEEERAHRDGARTP